MAFFSVIITTYNRAGLLQRALNSLLNQEEKDWEAIIVDDGSEDDTSTEIQPIIQSCKQLHLIHIKHTGSEFARNTGLRQASGEYLTFLDSDDEYLPDHLRLRKEILMKQRDIELLHGGVRVIGDDLVPDREHPGHLIAISDCVVGGTFFIRKDLFHRLNEFKEIPYGSDADFFERASNLGAKVLKTEHPTYIYHREHSGSITGTFAG